MTATPTGTPREDPGALAATPRGQAPTGVETLDSVHALLGSYIDYPGEDEHVAHTLWIAHTYLLDAWDTTPRLAFMSALPGSGKSRALELTALLVPRPIHTANSTHSALQHLAAQQDKRPTLLIDEIDTIYGSRAKGNEDLRAFINAGFGRGVESHRLSWNENGGRVLSRESYCAIALAGLEQLPSTIETRSIRIQMQRARPTTTLHPLRHKDRAHVGARERAALTHWTATLADTITDMLPTPNQWPYTVRDRARDVWEPLITVARAAGDEWEQRAWQACTHLTSIQRKARTDAPAELLHNLHTIFTGNDWDKASTEDIITALCSLPDTRWAGTDGPRLTARTLARHLSGFGIQSRNMRFKDGVRKGYDRNDLVPVWMTYLEPQTPDEDPGALAAAWPTPAAPGQGECTAPPITDGVNVPLFDA